MSEKEKKALLEDVSKLSPKDKAYVIGWCAHAASAAGDKQ